MTDTNANYMITREGKMKVVDKNIINLKLNRQPTKKQSTSLLNKYKGKILRPDEMNSEGHFILLVAINLFLSGDYEYCYRVCSRNFTNLVQNSLFEGNIRRFRAMAAERLFYHQRIEDGVDLTMLMISIESAH